MENRFQTVDEAIEWVHGLVPLGVKPGLERMQWMMEYLGHPERRLKFIHIAGTNGKGSTAKYIADVLYACDYDVGLFTSPYLESFAERIRFNGENIADKDLLESASRVKEAAEACAGQTDLGMPSEFEVVTAIALWYYAKISYPYFVVWETGLGGRLDSTNVVVPLVSVITQIGYDHQRLLGETTRDIAREKAGIIKSGVPVVSGVEDPDALDIITRTARERKAKLYQIGKDFLIGDLDMSPEGSRFSFQSYFRSFPDIRLQMLGEHQVRNAAVAIMTLEVLRQYYAALVDEEKLLPALAHSKWEGRMEMISTHPRVMLDGAHNRDGAVCLAKALEQIFPGEEIVMMAGFLRDKDIGGMLQALLPRCRRIVITEPNHGRAARAEDVAALAKSIAPQLQIDLFKDWKQALHFTRELLSESSLAVIAGSLYLVGDVRKAFLHH